MSASGNGNGNSATIPVPAPISSVATPGPKFAIVTVGLPARGKTFTARSLSRYLRWCNVSVRNYSVAEYRRHHFRNHPEKLGPSYYDPTNEDLYKLREELAMSALQDLIDYLAHEGGQVGIFDAANITRERRQLVHEKLSQHHIQVIFLEVICDRRESIDSNFRHAASYSPEYIGVSLESALADMHMRLSFYEPYYQTLSSLEADGSQSEESQTYSYIQIYNVNEALITNRIHGTLPTRMAFYLMNMHAATKSILFFKESELMRLSVLERLIGAFLDGQSSPSVSAAPSRCLEIWTSTYPPSIQLAKRLVASDRPYARFLSEPVHRSQISRLESPEHLSLSSDQIQALHPTEYAKYLTDPYNTRLSSQSESYADLSLRLESLLIELEGKSSSILIIAHESTLRCLYAYYMNTPARDIPGIVIEQDALVSLSPLAYGTVKTIYRWDANSSSVTTCSPTFQYTAA